MKLHFFKTLREKQSILNKLKKGDAVPFLKYLLYRFHISPLFYLRRKWYTMRVFYSPYAFWLWTHQDKEKDEELFFESFLNEGDTVVDCGAHIGTLTITAAKVVKEQGRVFAFEAHPRTFSYLLKNIKDNKCNNVVAKNIAIGNTEKMVSFSDYYASDLNGVEESGAYLVAMKTLDNELKYLPRIDLLKLDIEGCELLALIGGREILRKTKAVYFESAEKSFKRFGYTLQDIIKELRSFGFVIYHTQAGVIGEEVLDGHSTKTRYENILAVRK
ncbi:MAG: FkbM family methyltransferase [Candidatus Pacebacteria bacterium]|nr:FkbM family methyltransferase [Candidatus Paceibacterota bacterium]